MPKECAVCKQPAVVAARITRGEQTATAYFCENCARRVGQKMPIEIIGSAIQSLPKGTFLSPAALSREDNHISSFQQKQPSETASFTNHNSISSGEINRVKCHRCGALIPDRSKFCSECGASMNTSERTEKRESLISEQASTSRSGYTKSQAKTSNIIDNKKSRKTSRKSHILSVCILTTILLAVVGGGVYLSLNSKTIMCRLNKHDWIEATCVSGRMCNNCGIIDGNPLGHNWIDATCTTPKTCSRCGLTEGEPQHDAPDLSCTNSAICLRCGQEIPALGHKWKEATCTVPKTCDRCGLTEGEALGHIKSTTTRQENKKEATCTEAGYYDEVVFCTRCGITIEKTKKTISALGHTTKNGICSRCGLELYETVSGRGDDVITNIKVGDGLYRVHFQNSGRSNFVVWVYDKSGDKDLAVNEIGSFDGYYFLEGSAPYEFDIESTGSWSFQIERLRTTTSKSFSGKGCYVTDIFSASTGTWLITHSGSDNFVVWLWTSDGRDLIVNEIGKYDGKKRFTIPTGSKAFLVIEADGKWSISPAN